MIPNYAGRIFYFFAGFWQDIMPIKSNNSLCFDWFYPEAAGGDNKNFWFKKEPFAVAGRLYY